MIVNLVHNRLLLLGDLDGYPLCYNDGDTAPDDVKAGFLFLGFRNEGVLDEGVEVELVMQNVSS